MPPALAAVPGTRAAITLDSLSDAARAYAASSRSPNTARAYEGDLRRFASWCREHGFAAMPASPQTVGLYLTALAERGKRPSTIRRAKAAIAQAHRLAGHDPPPTDDARVRSVERGIRRELGTAPAQVRPLLPEELRVAFEQPPASSRAVRDRAMVLLGFAGAMRRSELVGLAARDIEFSAEGVVIRIRSSKTDPEGQGARIAVPFGEHEATCPVRALRAWLALLRSDATGPLFREVRGRAILRERASDRAVARAVKRVARAANLDADAYSGHSLRSGLATAAARTGRSDRAIMRQGRWRSRATVDAYVRAGRMWTDENAAQGVGL